MFDMHATDAPTCRHVPTLCRFVYHNCHPSSLRLPLQVNHLGHFLLTLELLPLILSSAPDARVVIVSSVGHKMANPFDPSSLEGELDYNRYKQYGSTKLFNVSYES